MDGDRLNDLRKDKGLTQKELAQILGVSENSVSLYERNLSSPDDDTKIKIAKYFNVSLDYLFGITQKQIPLNHTPSSLIYYKNLPENAEKEIDEFLHYIQNKYKL